MQQVAGDRQKRNVAIFVYFLAMAFEGFWLLGADFFSNGRDGAVQAAIVLWWFLFSAAVFLWRLPSITVVASAAGLIARMIWVWPKYLQVRTAQALLSGAGPDLILIAASYAVLRLRSRISNLSNPGMD